MTKFAIETPETYSVSKGPRDKSWQATCTIDVGKLSAEIMAKLAMHGLHQKIADAAAGSTTQAEAEASMQKAADALLAGEWSSRVAGDGASAETLVARSVVRSAVKAKFGAKSPEWAKFTGLSDAEQAAKLDEWFAANADAFQPAVDAEIKRRADAAKAKAKLGASLAIAL